MKTYDYLIVGAGLFGAVFAHEAKKAGKRCLVIDKRNHRGGNIYCEEIHGINVHKYGAHIFHTDNKEVWEYVNSFVEFNRYTNCPVATFEGKLYNLPFNMNTFYQLWGVKTPAEAQAKIEEQRQEYYDLFNDNDRFIERCVPAFNLLDNQIKALNEQIMERQRYIKDFEAWKAEGEAIDVDFQVLNY